MKRLVVLGLCAALAACAKAPEKIQAVAIDDATYQNMTCEHINRQKASYEGEYRSLAEQQRNASTGDAVGVLVLGVPGASLAGGDKETAIAVLKGKMEALARVSARQGC
jgi:hypothetical protein